MLKIVIISIIFVVYINFRKVEAVKLGSFDNVPNLFPNSLKNVVEGKYKGLDKNLGKNLADEMKKLKDENVTFLKAAENSNSSACEKLHDNVREMFSELLSIFDYCLDETQVSNIDVQKLTNLMKDVRKGLSGKMHNMLQCLPNSPKVISKCFTEELRNLNNLRSPFQEAVGSVLQLVTFPPDVQKCFETTYSKFSEDYFFNIFNDVGSCIESFIKNIM